MTETSSTSGLAFITGISLSETIISSFNSNDLISNSGLSYCFLALVIFSAV